VGIALKRRQRQQRSVSNGAHDVGVLCQPCSPSNTQTLEGEVQGVKCLGKKLFFVTIAVVKDGACSKFVELRFEHPFAVLNGSNSTCVPNLKTLAKSLKPNVLTTVSIKVEVKPQPPAAGAAAANAASTGYRGRERVSVSALLERSVTLQLADGEDGADTCTHDKEVKDNRHRVFADWVVQTFGVNQLQTGTGVVDVAGGKGEICRELCTQHAVSCTLVEPALRKTADFGWAADLQADGPHPHPDGGGGGCSFRHLQSCFGAELLAGAHGGRLRDCSLVLGMHPDQPTEAIVDFALQAGRPFAVVPCCVFPSLFTGRALRSGQGVKTYLGFVRYLLEKDPHIMQARLPFEGRNRVLFCRGAGPAPAPAPAAAAAVAVAAEAEAGAGAGAGAGEGTGEGEGTGSWTESERQGHLQGGGGGVGEAAARPWSSGGEEWQRRKDRARQRKRDAEAVASESRDQGAPASSGGGA
jgi:hypothetical protein